MGRGCGAWLSGPRLSYWDGSQSDAGDFESLGPKGATLAPILSGDGTWEVGVLAGGTYSSIM